MPNRFGSSGIHPRAREELYANTNPESTKKPAATYPPVWKRLQTPLRRSLTHRMMEPLFGLMIDGNPHGQGKARGRQRKHLWGSRTHSRILHGEERRGSQSLVNKL